MQKKKNWKLSLIKRVLDVFNKTFSQFFRENGIFTISLLMQVSIFLALHLLLQNLTPCYILIRTFSLAIPQYRTFRWAILPTKTKCSRSKGFKFSDYVSWKPDCQLKYHPSHQEKGGKQQILGDGHHPMQASPLNLSTITLVKRAN